MNWTTVYIGCIGCGILWTNRLKFAGMINSYCHKINDWYIHNPYTVNKFSNLNSEIIPNAVSNLLMYTYSFRNSKYIILSDPEKFIGIPYSVDDIDKKQCNDSISILTNSPSDIISSEIELSDGTKIDSIEYVKMLSGPLGDFYKDTYCQLTPDNLKEYLKYVFNTDNIISINYMLCDGNEYNLLNM